MSVISSNNDSQEVDHDSMAKRADEILAAIASLRASLGLQEAARVVVDQYVDEEPQPDLQRLGEVLAWSRRQSLVQEQLDADREELHHGHLDHDGRVSTGHHYEMLRRTACEYNHLLRGLIELSGQYFSREELLAWLGKASQGRHLWAKAEVSGAISEMALHAALQGLPELREMRYATLDEDLSGFDFIASWQGELVTVDAKTGFYSPLSEHKHGHRHLEISVPHDAVDDLRVTRRGLDLLRHEVRQALHREVEVEQHAPHHYYRAATA